MCELYFQRRFCLQVSVLMLLEVSGLAAAAQTKPAPWKINPYRNFLGCWGGTLSDKDTKGPTDVLVTITDDSARASMRWEFVYGHAGQKGYSTSLKYLLFSPRDAKIMMYYDREPRELLSAPGLNTFIASGFGQLAASYAFTASNYWHVHSRAEEHVLFTLTSDSLSYMRMEEHKGQDKTIYDLQLRRIACPVPPSANNTNP